MLVFTPIRMFVLASTISVTSMNIARDKMDWLGLPPSIRSYDILIIESMGGAILDFTYALSRVVKRGIQ